MVSPDFCPPISAATSLAGGAQDALRQRDYPMLMYYSFATLTSVGYGDIVAAKPAARMLSWWEAAVGQFYMAVLVARLVALHLQQRVEESKDEAKADTTQP